MSSSAPSFSPIEQNRNLLHRWFNEVWNQGRREVIAELLAPDCLLHDGSNQIRGPQQFEAYYDALNTQLKDIRITPGVSVCEGDMVSLRWHVECRHRQSDKPLSFSGTTIVRVKDGRFVEGWQNWDAAEMHAQLSA